MAVSFKHYLPTAKLKWKYIMQATYHYVHDTVVSLGNANRKYVLMPWECELLLILVVKKKVRQKKTDT